MKLNTTWLRNILGVLMILAGIQHFRDPAMYGPIIPDGLPKDLITYLSGAVEFLLGVGLFFQRSRLSASFGVLILMILFLPLHVADVFRDPPAMGSKLLAYLRLPVQFLLIAWALWVYKDARGYFRQGIR
ncbi:MAG: MauE/DoxX family redox-associated membrane protein [Flavobacteriales bacterium]